MADIVISVGRGFEHPGALDQRDTQHHAQTEHPLDVQRLDVLLPRTVRGLPHKYHCQCGVYDGDGDYLDEGMVE